MISKVVEDIVKQVREANDKALVSPVIVYSSGLLCCSACAPKAMTAEEVQAEVNATNICGTTQGWVISKDKTFKGGEPMPCPCSHDPERLHWLLEA